MNGIGTPWLPPSNTGVMNVVIGNSGTVAPVCAANVTGKLMRTNRRSADTTACSEMLIAPPVPPKGSPGPGNGVTCGMNTICPFTEYTCTSVTKN